jgi:hypothetical protein
VAVLSFWSLLLPPPPLPLPLLLLLLLLLLPLLIAQVVSIAQSMRQGPTLGAGEYWQPPSQTTTAF